jgi:hypothetical protein
MVVKLLGICAAVLLAGGATVEAHAVRIRASAKLGLRDAALRNLSTVVFMVSSVDLRL